MAPLRGRVACAAAGSDCAKYTLTNPREQHKRCRCAPLDPLLGLHCRNVLGNALCAERDLRVAYRTSREGPRDIVFVPNWFTCCELFPELPSTQGWVEAMTSLGRLIFFDQPGTGASDPVATGALPTLEQWADSIAAVLDALGSPKAALVTHPGALPTAALFAATHPSRTTALVVLEGAVDGTIRTEAIQEVVDGFAAAWGTGELEHVVNPDMPWNEESGPRGRDMNAWRRARGPLNSCSRSTPR